MNDHGSTRWRLLGASLVLTTGVLALVPGLTSPAELPVEPVGSSSSPSGAITIDGTEVSFSGGGTQTLGNGSGCRLLATPADNLLRFDGGDKDVGFVSGSVGIKSKGNGQDCGQVEADEALTVGLGTATVLEGLAISRADLDIEVLQDAGVTATAVLVDPAGAITDAITVGTFELLTGAQVPPGTPDVDNTPSSTSAVPVAYCSPRSSSGPNAADADNCFWTIQSDIPFNRLILTESSGGKASLQGGGDWPATGPGGPTVFHLTDAPDGILACGDVRSVGDPSLGGVITRLGSPEAGDNCDLKPYNFQIDGNVVEFEPAGSPGARYSGVITKDIAQPSPTAPTTDLSWIEYDKDGDGVLGFVPMQWCADDDLDGSTLPSTNDADGTAATWCVYAVDLSDPDATTGGVTAAYSVYGEDDPHWR